MAEENRNDRLLRESINLFCNEWRRKKGLKEVPIYEPKREALEGVDVSRTDTWEISLPYSAKVNPFERIWFNLQKDSMRAFEGRSVLYLCDTGNPKMMQTTRKVTGYFYPNYAEGAKVLSSIEFETEDYNIREYKNQVDVIRNFTGTIDDRLTLFRICIEEFAKSMAAKRYRSIAGNRGLTDPEAVAACDEIIDSFVIAFMNTKVKKHYWEKVDEWCQLAKSKK